MTWNYGLMVGLVGSMEGYCARFKIFAAICHDLEGCQLILILEFS